MAIRDILIPPEVEPAQPPVNISITSAMRQKVGHRAKSTVAKPVVVMMVTVWKAASVMESWKPTPACAHRLTHSSSVVAVTMPT